MNDRAVNGMMEIERKYLLTALPQLPASAKSIRIEQGYFAPSAEHEGRLRRARHPDGTVVCTHTIKRGSGVSRLEDERAISDTEFDRLWPLTAGRRLVKSRHRAFDPESGFTWEIDVFDALDVVLAEVELRHPDERPTFPAWLAPHVAREVTDEATYRNYELALRAMEAPPVDRARD